MPRFLVIHHAPGLTTDFQANVPVMLESTHATFVQVYGNLVEGVLITFYDADSQDAVERELERIGFPFDEIREVQLAGTAADLQKRIAG